MAPSGPEDSLIKNKGLLIDLYESVLPQNGNSCFPLSAISVESPFDVSLKINQTVHTFHILLLPAGLYIDAVQ